MCEIRKGLSESLKKLISIYDEMIGNKPEKKETACETPEVPGLIGIKEKRKKLKLTQREVAEFVGVKHHTIAKWEKNPQILMKEQNVKKLSEILQMDIVANIYIKQPKTKPKYSPEFYRARRKALKRDKGKCKECGIKSGLEVHHIVSRAKGGSDDSNNLITLCRLRHIEKHKGEPIAHLMHKRLFQAV